LASTKAKSRRGGHRKALDTEKRDLAVDLYQEKKMPASKICELMGIPKPIHNEFYHVLTCPA